MLSSNSQKFSILSLMFTSFDVQFEVQEFQGSEETERSSRF